MGGPLHDGPLEGEDGDRVLEGGVLEVQVAPADHHTSRTTTTEDGSGRLAQHREETSRRGGEQGVTASSARSPALGVPVTLPSTHRRPTQTHAEGEGPKVIQGDRCERGWLGRVCCCVLSSSSTRRSRRSSLAALTCPKPMTQKEWPCRCHGSVGHPIQHTGRQGGREGRRPAWSGVRGHPRADVDRPGRREEGRWWSPGGYGGGMCVGGGTHAAP